MPFVDRILNCIGCGCEFVFTADEQKFFEAKGFTHDPKSCKRCHAKFRGVRRRPNETRVVCAECGAMTTVPFKPTQGRPVLCRSCFQRGSIHIVRDCA
jgi:CxxC-x17-CxxC domain-containing protein